MIIVSWNINNDYRDIDDKIQMIIELLNTKNIEHVWYTRSYIRII